MDVRVSNIVGTKHYFGIKIINLHAYGCVGLVLSVSVQVKSLSIYLARKLLTVSSPVWSEPAWLSVTVLLPGP